MYAEKWTCKDGRQLHVYEMTDSHLANILAKMARTGWQWRQEWAERLLEEQRNRANV